MGSLLVSALTILGFRGLLPIGLISFGWLVCNHDSLGCYTASSSQGSWHGPHGHGGRGRHNGQSFSNSKPLCQIYGKTGYSALNCYHHFDVSYHGVVMSNNLSSPISSSQFPQTHIATTSTIHDSSWYLDSGAILHTMPNSVSLSSKSTYISPGALHVGNGTSLPISHIGNSSFDVLKPLNLRNVLLVPSIKKKMISISKFTIS